MEIKSKEVGLTGTKFYIEKDGKEIGRAYLYVMFNDQHDKPFGLMEDVFVHITLRGKGIGSTLVKKVIEEAKLMGCYKLIGTSRYNRPRVHELYRSLGFEDHGKEFRMNF